MKQKGVVRSHSPSLSQYRARHGWSQAELAEKSGVSRTEISAIETGRVVPSVAVALRLAAMLGETVETMFGTARASTGVPWAWPPAMPEDARVWRATMSGRVMAYPAELTAAGVIPHDGTVTGTEFTVVAAARPERTLVIAGCDPLVGLLVHEMAEHHGIRVIPLLRSSAQALDLLKQGLVHVAGTHLTNDDESSANDQHVLAELGAGYCLLHQLRWQAGVAVSPRRRERHVRDVLRANVRWVNRDEGSAARRALDRLLGRRPRPTGYTHVVRDHRAVAAAVAGGWADAGLCIRAAASEARLRFIHLHDEAYELCIAQSMLEDPRVEALNATLRSQRYRQWIGDVPGCVARDTSVQRMVV